MFILFSILKRRNIDLCVNVAVKAIIAEDKRILNIKDEEILTERKQ